MKGNTIPNKKFGNYEIKVTKKMQIPDGVMEI
jgi:hypothetical protein